MFENPLRNRQKIINNKFGFHEKKAFYKIISNILNSWQKLETNFKPYFNPICWIIPIKVFNFVYYEHLLKTQLKEYITIYNKESRK